LSRCAVQNLHCQLPIVQCSVTTALVKNCSAGVLLRDHTSLAVMTYFNYQGLRLRGQHKNQTKRNQIHRQTKSLCTNIHNYI
jgi:hypothetical protein